MSAATANAAVAAAAASRREPYLQEEQAGELGHVPATGGIEDESDTPSPPSFSENGGRGAAEVTALKRLSAAAAAVAVADTSDLHHRHGVAVDVGDNDDGYKGGGATFELGKPRMLFDGELNNGNFPALDTQLVSLGKIALLTTELNPA